MRLAFSVAAHLEPEILLVDEVLAVGDAAFRKKSLGKMEDLSGTGRTVLFVSHSMPSVLRLCPRVLLLDAGHLTADGTGSEVVEEYMGRGGGAAERVWPDPRSAPGDEHVRLRSVRVVSEQGSVMPEVDIREPVFVEVDYWNLSDDEDFRPILSLEFTNSEGVHLFTTHANRVPKAAGTQPGVVTHARCSIPGNLFAEGVVFVLAALISYQPRTFHAREADAVAFHVFDPGEGGGARGAFPGEFRGVMRPMLEWQEWRETSSRLDARSEDVQDRLRP